LGKKEEGSQTVSLSPEKKVAPRPKENMPQIGSLKIGVSNGRYGLHLHFSGFLLKISHHPKKPKGTEKTLFRRRRPLGCLL
jgi:hypothetical protein